jgi:hypothetical protein
MKKQNIDFVWIYTLTLTHDNFISTCFWASNKNKSKVDCILQGEGKGCNPFKLSKIEMVLPAKFNT